MSLMDVIDSLSSDEQIVVTRHTRGAYDADTGVWQRGAATTLVLPFVSIQPATGMQRVVGGRDMRSDVQGQQVPDVRVVYTNIELRTRESGFEPDTVDFEGGTWVVTRAERWHLGDEEVYRSLITRETRGSA